MGDDKARQGVIPALFRCGVGRETRPLRSGFQHVFDEDAVAHGGVVDQYMGDSAN